MQITELYICLFLMKLGIVALSVNIVVDNTKSTFTVGAVVGGLIVGLALSLALVALYLFKPIDVFDPFAKRKKNC
jgi:hypothetical protein